jgi:hypothetical protein
MEARAVTTLLFRSLLLLIILISLVVRFQGLRNRNEMVANHNVDTAIIEIVEDYGFPLRENPAKPPKVLSRAVYFQRPECGRTSLVLPFDINSEVLLYLDMLIKPGFERRFIYHEKSWETYDRFAMYFEWAKNVFLAGLGRPRFITERTAIVVVEPLDCNRSLSIDWRKAWNLERQRDSAGVKRADFSDRRLRLAAGQS